MFLKLINYFFGLFGYVWVVDDSPKDSVEEDVMTDEGWEDLDPDYMRYKLQKLNNHN